MSDCGPNYWRVGYNTAEATLLHMTANGNAKAFDVMRPDATGLSLTPERQTLFDTGWYAFARDQRELTSHQGPS